MLDNECLYDNEMLNTITKCLIQYQNVRYDNKMLDTITKCLIR